MDVGIWGGSSTTSLSISNMVSMSETTSESFTHTETESIDLPIVVPTHTYVNAFHYFIQYTVPVPFSGTVVLDGPVSANKDGIQRISQVLPKSADRTFDFQGVIMNKDIVDQKSRDITLFKAKVHLREARKSETNDGNHPVD